MQKLAELCIRRPVFATMLIVSLLVLGFNSYTRLGVDRFPKISFPTITVTTTLPGAAPEEVESSITRRIEEAVNTLEGIDEMRSVSGEGISQVFITFLLDKDPETAANEVRAKVGAVVRDLPEDADPPVVEKLDTDASPVLSIAISGDLSIRELTQRVDDVIRKNIESISGVGQVRLIGGRRRQIQVILNSEKLAAFNLTIDQVRTALRNQNVEFPGGLIEQGNRQLTLRTLGRLDNPERFADIIVDNIQGSPVRIRDLGTVRDSVEPVRTLARLKGHAAVVLEVRKQSGTNTVEVIRNVKQRIADLRPLLPEGYSITYARDQSTFIEESFHAVREHLVLGGLLAGLIVLLFMRNLRPTLIAAVAIPASIISTFTLIEWMGFTLNQITMLGLTLVVGVVIDDAIVVLENIFRFLEEKGLSGFDAAIQGTREVGMAVMTTTLSLVIVFLPVAYMSGIVGKFMSSFGFTAAFAVVVSLVVSFTLTPMLCSRFLKSTVKEGRRGSRDKGFYKVLSNGYLSSLRWCLRHRAIVAVAAILLSLSTIPLFVVLGKDFLPQDDQSEFEISVRTPLSSSPEGTAALLSEMETIVAALPHVQTYLTMVGADSQQKADRGSILVELTPQDEREESQQQLMVLARRRIQRRFPDLRVSVTPPAAISGGGFVNADLQFYVQGPDLEVLNQVSETLLEKLNSIPGVVDADSSYEPGKPEVRAVINRDKAAALGVTAQSIATALKTMVGGDDQATTFLDQDERYDVQLRVQPEDRSTVHAIARLLVPSKSVGNVPLGNVVTLERGSGPAQIDRYNRQRQITLTANIAPGQSLSNVLALLDSEVRSADLPPSFRTGLLGRSRELERSAKAYMFALLLSLAFMYIVMAALFESFIDPLTVMSTLPLAIPFALLPLFLTGQNFSVIYSSLGILMLFGVVKKNAILQVDHVNHLRRDAGLPRAEALLRGCADRLRPILMTTLSLVAGMVPLAVGGGAGSGSRRSVAVIIIGGQMLCLFLTLLVAPVVYTLLEDFVSSPRWKKAAWNLRTFGGLLGGSKPRPSGEVS